MANGMIEKMGKMGMKTGERMRGGKTYKLQKMKMKRGKC